MTNLCGDYNVRGCPASYYLSCPAYEAGRNCWEISETTPCCSEMQSEACANCPIHLAADEVSAKEVQHFRVE